MPVFLYISVPVLRPIFSCPHFMQSGESWILLSFKTAFKSNTRSEQVRSYILRKPIIYFFWLCCNFSSLRLQPLRRFTAKCCCLEAAAKVLPNSSDHIYYLAGGSCKLQFGASLIPVVNLSDEWLWSVWYTVRLHEGTLLLRVLGQTVATNIHAKHLIV